MGFKQAIKGAIRGYAGSSRNRSLAAPVRSSGDDMYCDRCGAVGAPKTDTPGSIWIEVVLWLCFVVPGLIYSIWRLNKRHRVCATCGSPELIPADSPKAVAARRKM